MAAEVDVSRLDETLSLLAEVGGWPDGVIDRLRRQIVEGEDESLSQINPIRWAGDAGVDEDLGIRLFLHATRVGLMEIHWSLRCRGCGELVANCGALGKLEHDFYCASCARSSPTTLDEHVEVSFSLSPEIRALRFHEPESLSLDDYFYRFRFSRNIMIRELERELIDFLREQKVILTWLEPNDEQVFELELGEPGWVVGNPRTMITVEGEPTTQTRELDLEYHLRSFKPRPTLAPGPVRLRLRNLEAQAVRVFLYFTPIVTYFDYLPHLSGLRLLNDPDFRRCLGTDVVRPGTGIPVNDNTLLFTDLRGSTAMYDKLGDNAAFELVSEHFEIMAKTITRNGGVVVKTMGDAIMASFSSPLPAVRAALAIIEDNERVGSPQGGPQLLPKVGVHRGSCIVVNQNDMVDYFGQTVNIAARVQGQARGNELCLTQAVWDEIRQDTELTRRLEQGGPLAPEHSELKGVSERVTVYRVLVR